jgi:hypothetical protein
MFCSGSIFGFLLGSVLAGSGLYYYVVDEYKVSNELLTEDVYVSLALGLHQSTTYDSSLHVSFRHSNPQSRG